MSEYETKLAELEATRCCECEGKGYFQDMIGNTLGAKYECQNCDGGINLDLFAEFLKTDSGIAYDNSPYERGLFYAGFKAGEGND